MFYTKIPQTAISRLISANQFKPLLEMCAAFCILNEIGAMRIIYLFVSQLPLAGGL